MKISGDGWTAKCPAHDDGTASLSISTGDEGRTLLHCHAGCTPDAICAALGLKLSDLFSGNGNAKRNGSRVKSKSAFDWQKCVSDFSEADVQKLVTWRGLSVEFVRWLHAQSIVGIFNGATAFANHGDDGKVVSCHVRLASCKWKFEPTGQRTAPLVFGDTKAAGFILAFESQWDAFTVMDKLGWHTGAGVPDTAIFCTRGSANGKLIRGQVNSDALIYAFTQNDTAAQTWLANIASNAGCKVLNVATPTPHKDANDWTRAGATNADLQSAMKTATEWTPRSMTEIGAASPGDECEEKILPFPLQYLPPAARAMAEAIARTERTPETLAGCCVLGFLSASIGAGLQVTSGPSRVTRGNLFIMPSAESGSGKSETFRHAARPFLAYEHDLVERWKAEVLPGLQAEAELLESEIVGLKKKAFKGESGIERATIRDELQAKKKALADVNARLNPPRLCCEDVTTEKLAVMLAHNQEQLASLSPDAGSIVNNLLGRYSKLDRTDEGIYLKAFSGDNCRVDRQGREPVLLQRPCLAALWLVQPDKLETLLGKTELTDGGMIPRLLVCHTRAQPRPIVNGVEGIPATTANAWAMLVGKLIQTFRMANEPFTIEPTPEARRMMDDHHNQIVERRLGELRDMTTFAARWNEQAWRIAVCLHAGLHGDDTGGRMLAADTVTNAIALADWFAGEQLRILALGRYAARRAKLDGVLELLADNPNGITARDVHRARIVGSADEARALLAQMEVDGEFTGKDSKPETGGHITRTFTKARK